MIKSIYIASAILLISGMASAQNEEDIVRYSVTTNAGSARSSAMGGAFGALGGDISTLGNNPAGIGVFRRSEISLTPGLNIANTKSNNTSVRNTSFQPASLGFVVTLYNEHFNWKGFNFGVNYTNLNNFNRKTNQYVYNSPTSTIQAWANDANYALDHGYEIPIVAEMAENVHLLNWNDTSCMYEPMLYNNDEVLQHKYIREEGYQGEYDISFGTNYKDKLYLGLAIGIQSIRYKYSSAYTGKASSDNPNEIDQYGHYQYLKTEGVGTGFKVGAIYRPLPELRIGASIHSPIYFSVSEDYEESMYSAFYTPDDNGDYEYDSYLDPFPLSYDYDMQTPWKAVFSLATVLRQKAILSVDYEFNNYNSARFSDGNGGFDYDQPGEANEYIREFLKNTNNVRIGAEYRVNGMFSLRSGYACLSSPYKSNGRKIQTVSGGFGLNLGAFYCDASYAYRFAEETTYFYRHIDDLGPQYDVIAEPVDNKYRTHEAKITIGFRL